jgi:hypothetical protein
MLREVTIWQTQLKSGHTEVGVLLARSEIYAYYHVY